MIRRLKIKFVCINMLIVTVMLTIIFSMVFNTMVHNIEEQGNRMLQSIHEDPLHRGPALRDRRVPYFMVTVSPQGTMSIASHGFFDRTRDQELLEIARTVYDGEDRHGVLMDHGLRFSRVSDARGEEIVFIDISMERSILRDLLKTCVQISVLSYAVFLVISILLAQWAVRPVEVAWKQQRQFVADASHELKTPLTVIMTNAELLQEQPYSEEEKNQFALSIVSMSQQMRGLVEGLLELARVDNGIIKTSFSECDFSTLVDHCMLPFEPMFFEQGMELTSEVDSGIWIRGSVSHLRQVVDILLDNAAKYGESHQKVEVKLRRNGRYALLSVSSMGTELTREDLNRIFERFYRSDKTRSMNHSYGLGLSIVKAIVKDHKGRIWAESKEGINSFYVQLPALSQKL